MRKEDAQLLTPGTWVRVGDEFLGRKLYDISDPEEMRKYLGTIITVKEVKLYRYGSRDLIEVHFDESDGQYFLIEEIAEIVQDEIPEESDMSIEDFLGIRGT